MLQYAIDDVASGNQQNSLEFRVVNPLGLPLELADQIQCLLKVGQLRSVFV